MFIHSLMMLNVIDIHSGYIPFFRSMGSKMQGGGGRGVTIKERHRLRLAQCNIYMCYSYDVLQT